MNSEPPASQASSHFSLGPISGLTLFELELARRERLSSWGTLRTGCSEVDENVLVQGFERGVVVGISAEEIDMGLLLALQTIAHNLVFGASGKPALRNATIITILAAPAIVPTLRDIIKAQVQRKLGQGHTDVNAQTRQCLERISVSRVFDIEGLWEVLSELEVEPSMPTAEEHNETEDGAPPAPEELDSSPLSSPPPSSPVTALPPLRTSRVEKTEIMDSEDEDELTSSSPASPALPEPPSHAEEPELPVPVPLAQDTHDLQGDHTHSPGAVLITHFSTLLNALFTQRDRSSAHTTLQLLSSHLRYLSHSSGLLIMLLNSTANTPSNPTSSLANTAPVTPGPPGKRTAERPLDPTLRSIFNPPPAAHASYGPGSVGLSRKNKPAFGLTFSQFLDLHLLCTRLAKTRADAEALFAPSTNSPATGARNIKYAWAVEVLLDESGYWDSAGKTRIDREQRWGAVDIKDGISIVDAFGKNEKQENTDMFRLAAGFGGRRV